MNVYGTFICNTQIGNKTNVHQPMNRQANCGHPDNGLLLRNINK